MGGDGSSFSVFMDGALGALLWCAISFAGWWLMFHAPLGRRTVRTEIRIKASPDKIWSTYLVEPSPPSGWGGAVEVSSQEFSGDPPEYHRANIRHGGVGPFRESVWRIVRSSPNAILETEQESLGAARIRAGDVASSFKLTPQGDETDVEHELRRMVRGVFGYLYVPRANTRVFEHLRAYCEGDEALELAPVVSRSARVLLAAVAFIVTIGVISAPNPEMWGIAVFVAFFLQLAMWLHEYGHLLAMRWFGHKDATLVMVPFLGGAAIGARQASTRFEKAVVALMGPALSGLIVLTLTPAADWGLRFLETGRAFTDWSRPDALQSWVGICVVAFLALAIPINLLNLAPVGVLDGGRAVSALATNSVSRALYVVGILAILAFALAGSGNEQQIGAAVVFVLLTWASSLLTRDQTSENFAPMSGRQLAVSLGLLAFTLAVYVDASRTLLPAFLEAVKTGIMKPVEPDASERAQKTENSAYVASPKRS